MDAADIQQQNPVDKYVQVVIPIKLINHRIPVEPAIMRHQEFKVHCHGMVIIGTTTTGCTISCGLDGYDFMQFISINRVLIIKRYRARAVEI